MQMVSNTRNNNYDTKALGTGASGGGNNNNNEPYPPTPPSITLETFFAQFLGSQRNVENSQKNMEDILRTIANNTQHGNHQGGNEVNQYSTFKDFMDTKPPIFKEAAEPLEADEWINTMEQKFRLLRLTEVLKTENVAH
jgi:hypothetical protein